MKSRAVIIAVLFAAAPIMVSATGTGTEVFGDPLKNASSQRIGNYDVQMTTEPKNLEYGSPSKIMVRMAGVNGDDLVDVPIVIRLARDGVEVQRTNPIIVPYGHHVYEYAFSQAGRYTLYLDLRDYAYSGQTLTFTFPVDVGSPWNFLYFMVPAAIGVTAAGIGGLVFMKKKKRQMKV